MAIRAVGSRRWRRVGRSAARLRRKVWYFKLLELRVNTQLSSRFAETTQLRGQLTDSPRAMEISIDECMDEVNASADGWLTFAPRRRLLLSLGTVWKQEGVEFTELMQDRYTMGLGHRRRAHLAILVAEKVVPVWAAQYPEQHPQRMIAGARRLLNGELSRRDLREDAGGFIGTGLASGARPNHDGLGFLLAGYAAGTAACVAVWDEYLVPDLDGEGMRQQDIDDPEDPDWWDPAVWAAGAHAGDMPWGERRWFHPERARQFWSWYLEEALPRALELAG